MKRILSFLLITPLLFMAGCTPFVVNDIEPPPDPGQKEPAGPTEPDNSSGESPPPEEPEPSSEPEPSQSQDETVEPSTEPEPEPEPEPDPPPSFGFIDAHADTISRAMLPNRNQGLYKNNIDVDFVRLQEYDAPVQVFVLWCSDRYVSTAFSRTNLMIDFFEREVEKHKDIIELALDLEDIERIARAGKISAILSIEGGEALMGKIENLDHFYNRGVRIFAPTWNRENELGYGQAQGSSRGLKPFGIECIKRMDELGIIMDVSHLNEAGFWDAHNNSTRPYMASHSNAYAVTPHARNLKDDQIKAIIDRGGIIGFNMYPLLLTQTDKASMDDVLAHFRHFIKIGAGNHLGLGCDFDGIPTMPAGIKGVESLKSFAVTLAGEFDEDTSFKIMESNFYEFFMRYFSQPQ